MFSKSNKPGLKILVWTGFAAGLIIAGCQFVIPRQEWNTKKWGPLVPHIRFPGDCSICHLPDRWDKLREDFSFDHEKETGYPLEGAHAEAACLRCHNDRGPVEAYVARGCAGCHLDPHAARMGMDCERCHSEFSWEATGLIGEHARTRFPLVGVHAIASCESCHEGAAAGEFRGAPVQCETCHYNDVTAVTDPNHVANGWVSDCQRCHNPVGWTGANILHEFFPLKGGHGGLDCVQCHTTPGRFSGLSQDCFACHNIDYQSASDHVALNFPQSCEQCHSTTAWIPAAIDHSFFPLTQGHAGLTCTQCHSSGTYAGLSQDCYACHQNDYQSAADHATLGFPHECAECHTVKAWTPAGFSHSFPLRSDHDVSCITCHDSGSTDVFNCLVCHAHNKTSMDDKHSGRSGYSYNSQACYNCHPTGRGD